MKSLLLTLTLWWIPVCGQASVTEEKPTCHDFIQMGTQFKMCVYPTSLQKKSLRSHFKASERILTGINEWMSDWLPESELSRINDLAGVKAVAVRKELFDVIEAALKVAGLTEGAFDISFNAFWGSYRYKKGEERAPSEMEINEKLPLVNFKNIEIDPKQKTVFLKKPRMKIGLGGIGQGYGVDQVVAYLKKHGFKAGYVDGSGDTFFWGTKPNGELWSIGVRNPFDHSQIVALISGTDFAVTTAGDDEKFFIKDGQRIHHILDPKTGRPSTASRQATVIARTAMIADAYDTASFVLGPNKAKTILEAQGLEGVLIGPTKEEVIFTKGLKRKKTPWGEVYETPYLGGN